MTTNNNSRLAVQAHIILHLGPNFGNLVIWGHCQYPTILNLESLHLSPAFGHLSRPLHILSNNSSLTIHELTNGHAPLAASILSSRPYHSISALTAAFNHHLWPMRCQSSTRSSIWRYWNMVITWALSWNIVKHILPMSLDTLKAFTFDLVAFGCTSPVIKSCWAAIQNRHKEFDYTPPIYGSGQYSAWERCIASAIGAPARIKFPVPKTIVHSLLLWRPYSILQHRNRLSTALATIICSRPSEVAQFQSCDFWPDFHTGYGIPGYKGTAAFNIKKKKNDSGRRGQLAAVGKSKNPDLDLVQQLKHWIFSMGLSPHPLCQKRSYPSRHCSFCPPLFPVLQKGARNSILATFQHCSPQQISDGVKSVCTHFGANPAYFSGISTRKGGITIAIEAGVPEEILFLQSGHGQTHTARRYMNFTNPASLFETFQAFDL